MKSLNFRSLSFGFAFISLFTLFFSSCELEGESNYTPKIVLIKYPNNTKGDTLKLFYTNDQDVLRMDTISVGDTVVFSVLLDATTNNLTAFELTQSAENIADIILPPNTALDSIFTTGSDYAKGEFLFKDAIPALFFIYRFVPKQVSNDLKLMMRVHSDAKFENVFGASNSSVIFIKTPIKAKVVN